MDFRKLFIRLVCNDNCLMSYCTHRQLSLTLLTVAKLVVTDSSVSAVHIRNFRKRTFPEANLSNVSANRQRPQWPITRRPIFGLSGRWRFYVKVVGATGRNVRFQLFRTVTIEVAIKCYTGRVTVFQLEELVAERVYIADVVRAINIGDSYLGRAMERLIEECNPTAITPTNAVTNNVHLGGTSARLN